MFNVLTSPSIIQDTKDILNGELNNTATVLSKLYSNDASPSNIHVTNFIHSIVLENRPEHEMPIYLSGNPIITSRAEIKPAVHSHFREDPFSIRAKIWAQRLSEKCETTFLEKTCENVLCSLYLSVNLSTERSSFVMRLHPYLHLQRQYSNCSWHHALSSIIGSHLNSTMRESDWLTGALVHFYQLDMKDTENLQTFNITTTFIQPKSNCIVTLDKVEIENRIRLYNSKMEASDSSSSFIEEGMNPVNKQS